LTKLRWDKARRRKAGLKAAGTDSWTPPYEKDQKAAKRAKRQRELRERSQERDRRLSEPGAIAKILADKRPPAPSGIHALIARILGRRKHKPVEKPE
jgi:hypothetical protein